MDGLEAGRFFVAHASPDVRAKESGGAWIASSWAFLVEPTGTSSCRVVSRFRADCSDDVLTRLSFGPSLLEPIGFAMDRRMLLGIRDRASAADRIRTR